MGLGLRALLAAGALLGGGCAASGQQGLHVPEVNLPGGAKLLPARARRLTNFEIENSLAALTNLPLAVSSELPPDVRQEGYTPNTNQDVSSAWAARYSALVAELAPRAAAQMLSQHSCAKLDATCRGLQVRKLGRLAFRRALNADEQRSLEDLLAEATARGESDASALELLLRALFESPNFLYLTELGSGSPTNQPIR